MMPIRLLNRICVLGAFAVVLLGADGVRARQEDRIIHAAGALPPTTPWKLAELSEAPVHQWAAGEGAVRSLFYAGEPYEGRSTRVFAYYASPATLAGDDSAGRVFPGVVLVHGGGGTAFRDWAKLWAGRGYAAMAMDLAGCGPERERLPDGGPDQTDAVKFGAIDRPPEDQWTYHAVANVIRAHSLLRSFREVDARRTAVTGISWGGYLTCIVAGLDNRFQAAVPVYGCGYLHENSVWLNRFAEMTPAQKERWVQWWDPSRYVGSAAMPVFFINGTHDFAYPLDSYAKTYSLVKGTRNIRITVKMPHSHPAGWASQEIGLFIDQYLREGLPLPVVGRPVCEDGRVRAEVTSRCPLVAAQLHFTRGNTPVNALAWTSTPAHLDANGIVSADLPGDATLWFLTVTDSRDAVVSSEVVFSKTVSTRDMWPGKRSSYHGFACYDFEHNGLRCKVVVPQEAAAGRPWIWRARFFGHEPQTEIALLKEGFHVAYVDVAGLYGSPQAVARWDAFYAYLTETRGFDRNAVLEGMSRGGLIVFNWAARNPDKVHCIYADAPVCDFKSWPGINQAIMTAYGLSREQAAVYPGNPVDNLKTLAEAGVPLLHVVGDADEVVPVAENTAVIETRYRALGGPIDVIHKPGVGHHPHSLEDPGPIVDFILTHVRRQGAS